jgi:eukaryotic-like serine/threonine-protein kinase
MSFRSLYRVDILFSLGTGSIFGASGTMAYDLRPSAYICLIYACLMVLLRAIVVPSTGTRTAIISVLTCLPVTGATVALVFLNRQDVPGPAYVSGGVLICAMSIGLATIVSTILYGLRKQVTEAMQLGQYTLDRKIGEGGNGTVYRARHALLRRPTALKVVLPDQTDGETLDRFEREVQHMSQLTHANTVAVYDYGRSPDGVFYYVMEYLDGIDLEQLVQRFGAQPADRVVPILMQVCGALAEAHRRGLIHRDIKPANIILSERGDVPDVAKVVDFGLVKEIASKDGASSRGILGTPSYIAPESVTDPDRVGPAADLYALGAVGYYLATGKRVFEGKTSVDVCVQHVTAVPRRPSELVAIPPELEDVLLRCLAKKPELRPASASELTRLLRQVPVGATWNEDIALQWWREFRTNAPPAPVPPETTTRSITIDLKSHMPQLAPAASG